MKTRTKPIKNPPVLFDKTQKLLGQVEKRLGAPVLTYWNSVNGSVCLHDVVALKEIVTKIGRQKKVYMFIKSEGGHGPAALRMVNLVWQYADTFTALIPLNAESAATMLALGAEELWMGPIAYITPVDTSLTHDLSPVDKDNERVSVGQNELTRILRLWRESYKGQPANPYQALYPYIHPLVIGSVDRVTSLSNMLCEEILGYHMKNKAKRRQISNRLNSDYPSHSYPIILREARRLGLNAKLMDNELQDMLLHLNELYSEMGQMSRTDFDERNHHDNEILNILEGHGIQICYQVDKDWHYRAEERKWVPLNDKGAWHKREQKGGRAVHSIMHIR